MPEFKVDDGYKRNRKNCENFNFISTLTCIGTIFKGFCLWINGNCKYTIIFQHIYAFFSLHESISLEAVWVWLWYRRGGGELRGHRVAGDLPRKIHARLSGLSVKKGRWVVIDIKKQYITVQVGERIRNISKNILIYSTIFLFLINFTFNLVILLLTHLSFFFDVNNTK